MVHRKRKGFTLIEMMVSVAVIIILTMIAIPSFQTLRQRSATRSAANPAQALWNQARFEAAKRNTYVKFALRSQVVSGKTEYCLGAATTTDPADATGCNCFATTYAAATSCNVAQYPKDQADWKGVTVTGTTNSALGVVVLDPKRVFLTDGSSGNAGGIRFTSPSGPDVYKINLRVDATGRAVQCEPTDATDKLSEFYERRCSP